MKNKKLTKGLHFSKPYLGYYYTYSNGVYTAFCGEIELSKHTTLIECLKSFENRQ